MCALSVMTRKTLHGAWTRGSHCAQELFLTASGLHGMMRARTQLGAVSELVEAVVTAEADVRAAAGLPGT